MQIIKSPKELREIILEQRDHGRVGLIPTMGALHAGHTALIQASRRSDDFVVMSIYVNPAQFGLGEDLSRYPRDLDRDACIAAEEGVDILFAPRDEDMYPTQPQDVWVRDDSIEGCMCGTFRPGHFRGVMTVVAKLFNMARPDRAYFGEKDYQQLVMIERMSQQLGYGIEVVRVPTVREADGLALSSRNAYMSAEERKVATVLHRALESGKSLMQSGERDASAVARHMQGVIAAEPGCKGQYIGAYDALTLHTLFGPLSGTILLAGAIQVGTARIIDNLLIRVG